MNPHLKGSLLIVLSMLLYSIRSVFIRIIPLEVPTLLAYFEIFFLSFLIVSIFLTKKIDSFKIHHPKLLLLSSAILIVILLTSHYTALRLTTFANAMFVLYTAPIFALIIAVIFLKEKLDWQSVAAIIISMLGLYFIFDSVQLDSSQLLGVFLGIIAALSYGIVLNINKVLVRRGHILSMILYQTIPITLILSPFLFVQLPSLQDLFYLLIMASLGGLIASIISLNGLKTVKAQHAGIIAYIEILFVILLGFLFFQEIPSKTTWIGGLLIILAGVWIIIDEAMRKDKAN